MKIKAEIKSMERLEIDIFKAILQSLLSSSPYKGRRFNICRSRRFIKKVCRSSQQINFTLPQKKEKQTKKVSLMYFQT